MSKPIYKAQEKPYQNDINDLIEADEIAKGRGPDKSPRNRRGQGPKVDHDKNIREARLNNRPDQVEHHTNAKRQARKEEISRMSPSEKEAKMKELDAKIQSMKKPNPGT